MIAGFSFLILVGIGIVAVRSKAPSGRFEAHEFAVFQSTYDRLRIQDSAMRAEFFRDLLETTETAKLTPAMGEALSEFLEKVVASQEEVPEVKAEATLVLRSLEKSLPERMPASSEKTP